MTRNSDKQTLLILAVLVPAVFAGLVSLSWWQLQRGNDKAALHRAFDSTAGMQELAAPSHADLAEAGLYSDVSLAGHYMTDRQFLLDNMNGSGGAGYHVLTPFRIEGSDAVVLVDRGWVRKDFGAALPAIDVGAGARKVSGKLAPLPRPGLVLPAEEASGWPRVVQFSSLEVLAGQLGEPLGEFILLLAASDGDGFERDWQPPGLLPERHYAYAFQWGALALTWVTIFVVLAVRRQRRKRSTTESE
ncbi:MAG: SURF1 family protein [Gammaproteobacteria bacterium]|nr:SURF1 family protein [Gammaproteobacteria bacterium]